MSGSERPEAITDGFPCPSCGQQTTFKYSDAGTLVHLDGSELCTTPEPVRAWPPAAAHAPIVSGDPALIGTAERRRYVAEWRHTSEIDPEDERRPPMMGVIICYVLALVFIASCGWVAWHFWPNR